MGEVIGNAQQRLKLGCCLQLYVIPVLEKEETLLNCTPCAPGNLNYCLCCTAVSDQLCGSWDFALFGRNLPPPDGYFSVILQRRTLFWVPFSIFLSLKKIQSMFTLQNKYYAGHGFLLCVKMILSPQCKSVESGLVRDA